MGRWSVSIVAMLAMAVAAAAQKPPLLAEAEVAALAQELSGEIAKRNLEGIARFHRQRGSQGFHAAAELVAERSRAYGLSDVAIMKFPADGKLFYGTQRSRPGWDAELAELWELKDERPAFKLASYDAEPVVLAQDSESAEVAADLVDVADGTQESDYAGKDVKGKMVLAGAQPGAVQDLAVGKLGAAGIVSYAQNQKTAWWGEDENLIRWGHLETFSPSKTFAFMVSLKTARALRARLGKGERIRLRATVKAGQHPGNYEVVTATIPGADQKLEEEVAFSCHLDHQRPGANDNASGCVTILEIARTLQKLIQDGRLSRPARTIRFLWPPEIEGTVALLNARPDLARRIKFAVHMDMVGGGPSTKAIFHVTRGPMSLPSFVHDVAWTFADFVNQQSHEFAATGAANHPLFAQGGGKEPLLAQFGAFTMGSDHDVYQDSSFKIPAIYLNDWPDRYIHTNFDTAANIDPTKLLRAAFIGAASGYVLANKGREEIERAVLLGRALRIAQSKSRLLFNTAAEETCNLEEALDTFERAVAESARAFTGQKPKSLTSDAPVSCARAAEGSKDASLVFARNAALKGPMAVFGYDYFAGRAKAAGIATPKLQPEYAYEVLNFADGKRSARQIRDAVSAEYGPVSLEHVLEYLRALEKIGVVQRQ